MLLATAEVFSLPPTPLICSASLGIFLFDQRERIKLTHKPRTTSYILVILISRCGDSSQGSNLMNVLVVMVVSSSNTNALVQSIYWWNSGICLGSKSSALSISLITLLKFYHYYILKRKKSFTACKWRPSLYIVTAWPGQYSSQPSHRILYITVNCAKGGQEASWENISTANLLEMSKSLT